MVSVSLPFDNSATMRNILHVEGKADNRETFHFFVNHWTSRSDGAQKSEPMRLYTAIALRKAVDGVLNKDNTAKVIILGDFNDEPTSRSIFEMLYANNKRKNASSRELYNLMYDMHNNDLENDTGTYNFMGNWNMLDQIIVSQQVIKDQDGYHTSFNGGRIFKEEWILYFDQNLLESLPDRTYGGDVYYGGFSDHLPVYVILRRE
jgi:endonuclease/exonuclease/phosphatase family metal-dependent hydrolase